MLTTTQDENDSEPDVKTGKSLQTSMPKYPRKRKPDASIVPRLFENKQQHLETNQSTALFCAQSFYERNKNYADFRNYLQLVRELNDCFSNSVKERSKSVPDFSKVCVHQHAQDCFIPLNV